MKNDITKQIKESLENYELPYNESAWKTMSGKLDALQPAGSVAAKGGISLLGKAGIAVGSIALIGSVLYFATRNSSERQERIAEQKTTANKTIEQKNTQKENKISNVAVKVDNNSEQSLVSVHNTPTTFTQEEMEQHSTDANLNQPVIGGTSEDEANNERLSGAETDTTFGSTPSEIFPNKWIAPKFGLLCAGENVSISNSNSEAIYAVNGSKEIEIPAKSTQTLMHVSAGNLVILTPSGKELTSKEVHPTPKVNFNADLNTKNVNGVPTLPLMTYSNAKELTWHWKSNSTNITKSGNEVTAHFFEKGNYTITLQAKNVSGCEATFSKTFAIDKNYNLFAPNAFEPSSSDPRRATFMPEALTVRNLHFKMIILDPKTGQLVFETTDASDRWDGVNQQTGKLVAPNAPFVWKVQLENPLPGEDSEYTGTIMHTRIK